MEIKVLTYNTALHFPDYGALLRAEKLRSILELGKWDFIGLCEVYHPSLRKILLGSETIKQIYPYQVYNLNQYANFDNGTVFLSKHRIKSVQRHQYRSFHSVWYNRILPPKDVIFAIVELQKVDVGVFVTHLQWGASQAFQKVRKRHILELQEFIESKWSKDKPCILMGDLNINGNSEDEEYRFLRKRLFTINDWWEETHDMNKDPGYTWDPANSKVITPLRHERLDYILSNQQIRPVKTRLLKFNAIQGRKFVLPKGLLSTKERMWFSVARFIRVLHIPMYILLIFFYNLRRITERFPLAVYYSDLDLSDHYAIEGTGELSLQG
ncbi:MAG: endonuclease/exonuclease/phosphatase family protein [Candidatus Kariarchaeaceae archaeon]|jgi:endonuclease/exonuclease/phosphatase family metal-dependent hydrolase